VALKRIPLVLMNFAIKDAIIGPKRKKARRQMRSRWALLLVLMHIGGFSGAATAQTFDQRLCAAPNPDLSISGCTG
jgi:hypothetical protein